MLLRHEYEWSSVWSHKMQRKRFTDLSSVKRRGEGRAFPLPKFVIRIGWASFDSFHPPTGIAQHRPVDRLSDRRGLLCKFDGTAVVIWRFIRHGPSCACARRDCDQSRYRPVNTLELDRILAASPSSPLFSVTYYACVYAHPHKYNRELQQCAPPLHGFHRE